MSDHQPISELLESAVRKTETKRIPFRIDMTPMVDVAFLLLTFFMLTTVFKKPGSLRMSLPDQKANSPQTAGDSKSVSILINEESKLFFQDTDGNQREVNLAELQKILISKKSSDNDFKLFLKPHEQATYDQLIQVMDLLEFIQLSKFSMGKFPESNSKN